MKLNRHEFPNGGWIWFQPQTGWRNPMPLAFTFDRTVEEIIKHRKMNPAITAKHNLSTDFNVVADELEAFTRKRLKIPDSPIPKTMASLRVAQRVEAVAAVVKNMGIGAGNLLAWSDSGKVVPKEQAEVRASVCVGCNQNGKGDWRNFFTEPAAMLLARQLSAKNSMKLETTKDNELGVCEVCACPLALKVWSPLEYALRKMSDETKAKLPEWCWMKTEAK